MNLCQELLLGMLQGKMFLQNPHPINANCPYQFYWLILLTQQTFVGLEDVLKTSSKHVLKTHSTRLQRKNFWSSKTSGRRLAKTFWRRLEDISQDVLQERRTIVTLKTPSRHLDGMSWRRLKDMSWSRLQDMSWSRLSNMSSRHLHDVLEKKKNEDICI